VTYGLEVREKAFVIIGRSSGMPGIIGYFVFIVGYHWLIFGDILRRLSPNYPHFAKPFRQQPQGFSQLLSPRTWQSGPGFSISIVRGLSSRTGIKFTRHRLTMKAKEKGH